MDFGQFPETCSFGRIQFCHTRSVYIIYELTFYYLIWEAFYLFFGANRDACNQKLINNVNYHEQLGAVWERIIF
jgi:hypothetical protein